MHDVIAAWRIAAMAAYATSPVVWYACWRRRRSDLVVLAVAVHVLTFLRFFQTQFIPSDHTHGGDTGDPGTSGDIYTILVRANAIDQLGLFAIDFGTAVLFIYSAALVNVWTERAMALAVLVLLAVIYTTNISAAASWLSRLLVTAPLFAFYFAERLLRTLPVASDYMIYLAGYLFFYAAFFASAVESVHPTPLYRVVLHAVWITLTNASLALIILSISPPQRPRHLAHTKLPAVENFPT